MILNDLSEGFATLIAVFLGAGMTIVTTFITEKQAQKNRIKEQVREHQIESVKTIVHTMQTLDYLTNRLYQLLNSELYEITTMQSQAQKINKEKNIKQHFLEERNKLIEQEEVILQELWELRFLKYNMAEITLIEQYLEHLCSIKSKLEDYSHKELENCDFTIIEQEAKELHLTFIKYVEGARNGLS